MLCRAARTAALALVLTALCACTAIPPSSKLTEQAVSVRCVLAWRGWETLRDAVRVSLPSQSGYLRQISLRDRLPSTFRKNGIPVSEYRDLQLPLTQLGATRQTLVPRRPRRVLYFSRLRPTAQRVRTYQSASTVEYERFCGTCKHVRLVLEGFTDLPPAIARRRTPTSADVLRSLNAMALWPFQWAIPPFRNRDTGHEASLLIFVFVTDTQLAQSASL